MMIMRLTNDNHRLPILLRSPKQSDAIFALYPADAKVILKREFDVIMQDGSKGTRETFLIGGKPIIRIDRANARHYCRVYDVRNSNVG